MKNYLTISGPNKNKEIEDDQNFGYDFFVFLYFPTGKEINRREQNNKGVHNVFEQVTICSTLEFVSQSLSKEYVFTT